MCGITHKTEIILQPCISGEVIWKLNYSMFTLADIPNNKKDEGGESDETAPLLTLTEGIIVGVLAL